MSNKARRLGHITGTIALHVESSLLVAACLRGTDTRRISAPTWSWVRILRRTECDRCDSGEDDEELHFRVVLAD
jgi:hypothetical protein